MGAGSTPLVRLLPGLGAAAWLGAVLWSARLDPWGPFGAYQFYGLAAPAWLPYVLLAVGLVGLVGAAVRDAYGWPYLAVAPVAVLGGGSRLLASEALVDLLVFAGLLLATAELLSAKVRFDAVVASARNLGKEEKTPVGQFLARYLGGVLLLTAFYGALLFGAVRWGLPWLASLVSPRLADSVELQSSVGIVVFSSALLATAALVRLLVDGLRSRASKPEAGEERVDIRDLKPIQREGPSA